MPNFAHEQIEGFLPCENPEKRILDIAHTLTGLGDYRLEVRQSYNTVTPRTIILMGYHGESLVSLQVMENEPQVLIHVSGQVRNDLCQAMSGVIPEVVWGEREIVR